MPISMPLAHSGGHFLQIHLESVSAIAAGFASAADTSGPSAPWARLAGMWHDLGKYRPGFHNKPAPQVLVNLIAGHGPHSLYPQAAGARHDD